MISYKFNLFIIHEYINICMNVYMSYTIHISAIKVKSQLINEFQVILRVRMYVMSKKDVGYEFIILFNIMITMLKYL